MKHVVAVALLIAAPSILAAQKSTLPMVCVFDTAAHRDTSVITLSLRVRNADDTATNAEANEALAAALRERWHPPQSIGRMFYPYTSGGREPNARIVRTSFTPAVVHGAITFAIGSDRRLHDLALETTTGDSATDDSFIAALRDADRDSAVTAFVRALGARDSSVLELVRSSGDGSAPLIRLHVPQIIVDSPAALQKAAELDYPSVDLRQGRPGFVRLQYVVSETGLAEPESMHVLAATNARFAKSARSTLLKSRFTPATAAGCPVKMMVEQTVRFSATPR